MNPLRVIIVKPEDPNAFSGGVSVVGAIVWMAGVSLYWSGAGLFDATPGRLCFIPALIAAAMIGYATTHFIICVSVLFTIFGLLVGWIFDFPFFDTTLIYIAKAYQFLFR